MKVERVSPAMKGLLNQQIKFEGESSHIYLAMSNWCNWKGFENSGAFMRKHADEERAHMMKFTDYVLARNVRASVPAMGEPTAEYPNLADMFSRALAHEFVITDKIKGIAKQAQAEGDMQTYEFALMMLKEQVEEEDTFFAIVDMIETMGEMPGKEFFIDQAIHEKL